MTKQTIAASAKKPKAKPTKSAKTETKHRYKAFKLQKRIRHPGSKLTGSFRLFKDSLELVMQHWKIFGGITLVYLLLTLLLVSGFGSRLDVPELKTELQTIFTGSTADLTTGLTLFGLLLGTTNAAASEGGAAYQSMIIIMISLAVIWTLRQVMASQSASVRDAFYKGMYPLVPFVLILLIMGLQLIPFFIGAVMYTAAGSAGVASTLLEQFIWGTLLFLLTLVSLYMLTSSVLALYIVTLPNMRPLAALRSARGLVRHRRWTVMRKILFLPVILLVIGAVITVPLVLFAAPIAHWVFLVLTMSALVVSHAYIYSLYRELL